MFAKIVFIFAVVAAVQATGFVGPIGLEGFEYKTGLGHRIVSYGAGLGYDGAGLISGRVPAVSTQKAVINHAPATPAVAAATITLAGSAYGLGYAGNGLLGGHGLGEIGLIAGGVPAVATQKAVINYVAPVASAVAGPAYALGYAGNGLLGGHGLGGTGLIAGGIPAVATQKAVINHTPAAPVVATAPVALAGPTYGLGYVGNGLIGGHGFSLGNGLLGAPYDLGLGAGKLGLGFGKALL